MLTVEQKLELLSIKKQLISDNISKEEIKRKIRNKKNNLNSKNRRLLAQDCTNKSIHHIFPQSKYRFLLNNIVELNHLDHKNYHKFFGNKDPYEILDYLVVNFWGGKLEIIENYITKRICSK